jgi:hypothetical protein
VCLCRHLLSSSTGGSSSSSSSGSSIGFADAFVAEHVWEHLSLEAAHVAARNCYAHLSPGGTLRIAVPDPNHQSDAPVLRGSSSSSSSSSSVDSTAAAAATTAAAPAESEVDDQLKLPNWLEARHLTADMRDGHSVQYTVQLLSSVCTAAGFESIILQEWNDSSGQFHSRALLSGASLQADAQRFGAVKRSAAGGDSSGGVSIVLDCVKSGDAPSPTAAQLPAAGAYCSERPHCVTVTACVVSLMLALPQWLTLHKCLRVLHMLTITIVFVYTYIPTVQKSRHIFTTHNSSTPTACAAMLCMQQQKLG